MRSSHLIGLGLTIVAFVAASCHDEDKPATDTKKQAVITEENVDYSGDGVNMKGFMAYDSASADKKPAVIVVHEWWGLDDYPKMRAKQLADLGYVAFAIDLFGEGRTTGHPDTAGMLAGPFYQNPATLVLTLLLLAFLGVL